MDRKEYMREYQKKWKAENKEKLYEYSKRGNAKDKAENPLFYVKKIFRERRRYAGLKGIPFTITLDDLPPVPTHCPVLGIELISGRGSNNPNAASLDRIIPTLGYVPGNICWISFRANRLKCDGTMEEIEKLLKWMQSHDLRQT